MQFDKSSIKSENKDWKRDIFISAANFKYPTVKTKELKKIPIQDICADDCLLFMWVTNPHLAQGIELGQSWGFEYKTVGFVWDKCNHNPGQYTLSNCALFSREVVYQNHEVPETYNNWLECQEQNIVLNQLKFYTISKKCFLLKRK